jgi:hypothetical protein
MDRRAVRPHRVRFGPTGYQEGPVPGRDLPVRQHSIASAQLLWQARRSDVQARGPAVRAAVTRAVVTCPRRRNHGFLSADRPVSDGAVPARRWTSEHETALCARARQPEARAFRGKRAAVLLSDGRWIGLFVQGKLKKMPISRWRHADHATLQADWAPPVCRRRSTSP